jgi:hypothetical protein
MAEEDAVIHVSHDGIETCCGLAAPEVLTDAAAEGTPCWTCWYRHAKHGEASGDPEVREAAEELRNQLEITAGQEWRERQIELAQRTAFRMTGAQKHALAAAHQRWQAAVAKGREKNDELVEATVDEDLPSPTKSATRHQAPVSFKNQATCLACNQVETPPGQGLCRRCRRARKAAPELVKRALESDFTLKRTQDALDRGNEVLNEVIRILGAGEHDLDIVAAVKALKDVAARAQRQFVVSEALRVAVDLSDDVLQDGMMKILEWEDDTPGPNWRELAFEAMDRHSAGFEERHRQSLEVLALHGEFE